jgi:hypothetical protein
MRRPEKGRAHPEVVGETGNPPTCSPEAAPSQIDFLKRRLAAAILTGDDETAARRIAEPDRLLNGRLAR